MVGRDELPAGDALPDGLAAPICQADKAGGFRGRHVLTKFARLYYFAHTGLLKRGSVYTKLYLLRVPALFFMVFMLRYGEYLSFTFRIFFSFVLLALLILAVPFVCDMGDVAFDMMIAICLCIGILQAISQSSVFGFTALLPPAYNGAAMTGEAVAGIVVCGIRIATKLSFPDSDHGTIDASRIFFYTACAWCAACAILFILILRFGFTKYPTLNGSK